MPEYAVNIADLTSHSVFALALGPYLTHEQVSAEPDMLDGLAVRVGVSTAREQKVALAKTVTKFFPCEKD